MGNRTLFIPLGGGGGIDPANYYTKSQIDTLIADFITDTVDDLVNYYTKSETYTQTEVNTLIGNIETIHFEFAASTSDVTDPQNNVIYLIGPTGSGSDQYEEYVYSNNTWTKIGDTSIDLSDYITSDELATTLNDYVTTSGLATTLADYVTTLALGTVLSDYTPTAQLSTVATSGSYNDLTDKPSIPAVGTGVVTLTSGGSTIGTFGLNDTADKTIDIPSSSKIELTELSLQEQLEFYQATLAGTMKDFSQFTANGYPLINAYVMSAGVDIPISEGNTYTTDGTEVALMMNQKSYLADGGKIIRRMSQCITLFSPTIVQTYGSTIDLVPAIQGAYGTNDGTNWTSLTIGFDTFAIPQGGGSSNNAWYGSQYQFDTLGTYDADTDYYISDINYSEIKGTPNLNNYTTKIETDAIKAESQAADAALDSKIAGKMDPIVFLGTAGLPSIGTPLEGVVYAIEGETVALTFTLANLSTVTYNFVID